MMQLIGMLDSPYVRRVALSLDALSLAFEHKSISVFSTFAQFQAINPVVKAPTLVCDDGEVLMDSTLILQYAEALSQPKSLMPRDIKEHQHALRVIGLSLAACEKAVQIIYERNLRPAEKQHEPWLTRVQGQLLAAFQLLEKEVTLHPMTATANGLGQASISAAVAWHFTQKMIPESVDAAGYPMLRALSETSEQLPGFKKYPHEGPGVKADGK
ncbi:MAG TPA: glutathione S-transferase [Steroidobacteraceae bacterium]|nr:glutathione S-transferase [Steroidobacteraceae bacterium]